MRTSFERWDRRRKKRQAVKRQTVSRESELIPATLDFRSAEAEAKRRTMKACLLELRRQLRAATKPETTTGKAPTQLAETSSYQCTH